MGNEHTSITLNQAANCNSSRMLRPQEDALPPQLYQAAQPLPPALSQGAFPECWGCISIPAAPPKHTAGGPGPTLQPRARRNVLSEMQGTRSPLWYPSRTKGRGSRAATQNRGCFPVPVSSGDIPMQCDGTSGDRHTLLIWHQPAEAHGGGNIPQHPLIKPPALTALGCHGCPHFPSWQPDAERGESQQRLPRAVTQ